MEILYRDDAPLSAAAFVELYRSCSLGVRRPLDDPESVSAMMRHGSLMVTAWDGELIVGIARTLTDFAYVGYLADLAVRETIRSAVSASGSSTKRAGEWACVRSYLGRSAGRPRILRPHRVRPRTACMDTPPGSRAPRRGGPRLKRYPRS